MDGLVEGHERPAASPRFPDCRGSLFTDVRRAYGGTLTYDARWREGVEGMAFRDRQGRTVRLPER
jgi:hypothetical protein